MNSYLLTLGVPEGVARSIAFVKKLSQPIFTERDGSVEIAFTSELSLELYRTKVSVEKKKRGCTGSVTRCSSTATSSTATSSNDVPPATEAPTTTLAMRTSLASVKEACAALSSGEKHALMVWLALDAEMHRANPVIEAMLSEKRKMAMGFSSLLAGDWGTIEAPLDPGTRCGCKCGCNVWGVGGKLCFVCKQVLCPQCHPAGRPPRAAHCAKDMLHFENINPSHSCYFYTKPAADGNTRQCCHNCANRPKLVDMPVAPPQRYGSLNYYFNGPFEPMNSQLGPRVLSSIYGELANRDVRLDPRLLYVENVSKDVRFEDLDARRQYPPRWERGFSVIAVLGGPEDSEVRATINMECFMMKPAWKLDGGIKMASEFMKCRDNWGGYVGALIKPQPQVVITTTLLDSTCTFEELNSDVDSYVGDLQIEDGLGPETVAMDDEQRAKEAAHDAEIVELRRMDAEAIKIEEQQREDAVRARMKRDEKKEAADREARRQSFLSNATLEDEGDLNDFSTALARKRTADEAALVERARGKQRRSS